MKEKRVEAHDDGDACGGLGKGYRRGARRYGAASDKPHSRQNTGTYNMKQHVVTESSDEGGQIVYRCAIEVYNVLTGRTDMRGFCPGQD